jgi:hypothetical protein
MARWADEHGEEYAVPAEILAIDGIVDLSWHNDVCPRFAVHDEGFGPNLWVDHPDPDKREMCPTPRFLVLRQVGEEGSADDIALYHGDNLTAAIDAFRTALPTGLIEMCDAGNGWTDAWLLNESRTLRIANLGMWHSSGGWVNDTPDGNERDVTEYGLWLSGIDALAKSLTQSN